jgi:hypothetical protein
MNYFTANRTSNKCQFQTKLAYRFDVLIKEMGRISYTLLAVIEKTNQDYGEYPRMM